MMSPGVGTYTERRMFVFLAVVGLAVAALVLGVGSLLARRRKTPMTRGLVFAASALVSLGLALAGLSVGWSLSSTSQLVNEMNSQLHTFNQCVSFNEEGGLSAEEAASACGGSSSGETCTRTASSVSCSSGPLIAVRDGPVEGGHGSDGWWWIGVLGAWALFVSFSAWLTFGRRPRASVSEFATSPPEG